MSNKIIKYYEEYAELVDKVTDYYNKNIYKLKQNDKEIGFSILIQNLISATVDFDESLITLEKLLKKSKNVRRKH